MPNPHTPGPGPARLGRAMTYGAWLLALGLLTWGFNNWLEAERNPNRHLQAVGGDDAEVVLVRNRYGHYHASGTINGAPVEFLLDTGATTVAVPAALARRLGLEAGAPTSVQTANGTAIAYTTRLDRVAFGAIVLSDVRAHINPGMAGSEVLLGMSALKELEFAQRGDTLTLRRPRPDQRN